MNRFSYCFSGLLSGFLVFNIAHSAFALPVSSGTSKPSSIAISKPETPGFFGDPGFFGNDTPLEFRISLSRLGPPLAENESIVRGSQEEIKALNLALPPGSKKIYLSNADLKKRYTYSNSISFPDLSPISIPVEIERRGQMRYSSLFPPLKIIWKRVSVASTPLAKLFDNDIKIETPEWFSYGEAVEPPSISKSGLPIFSEIDAREKLRITLHYHTYKLLEFFSPYALKTRSFNLSIRYEPEGIVRSNIFGFFLEPLKDLAARNGKFEIGSADVGRIFPQKHNASGSAPGENLEFKAWFTQRMDEQHKALMAIPMAIIYLGGNGDHSYYWSNNNVSFLGDKTAAGGPNENSVVMKKNLENNSKIIPVYFDFDGAALGFFDKPFVSCEGTISEKRLMFKNALWLSPEYQNATKYLGSSEYLEPSIDLSNHSTEWKTNAIRGVTQSLAYLNKIKFELKAETLNHHICMAEHILKLLTKP